MTPEEMELVFTSSWFALLMGAAVLSCAWYYLTHMKRTIEHPEMRTPTSLAKRFLYGNPIALFGIVALVILALALYNWITTGHLGLWI